VNVAHLVLSLNFGGLERLVIQLSEELKRRGMDSSIVALTDGHLLDEANRRGVRAQALHKRTGFSPGVPFQLARVLRDLRVDVLHTHNFSPLIYGTLAATLCRIPTLNTRHGRAALRTYSWVWSLTDHVVAVSHDARTELLRHNAIPADKVTVIWNGIDLSPYRVAQSTDIRAELGVRGDRPLIGTVGRLSEEKDHETLLRAFQAALESGLAAELVIAGGGSMEERLKELARALSIESEVHFLGFRKDVAAVLRGCDLYVQSSRMEGVSLTVIEAMAAGLPVVATRVGGNPEVVQDGITGMLVPAAEPAALAAAIVAIAGDRQTAKRMGEAGRQRAYDIFSLDVMADAYLHLYERLLGKPCN
jgi:glycosyltransferase involved in cell wall biosynthesis